MKRINPLLVMALMMLSCQESAVLDDESRTCEVSLSISVPTTKVYGSEDSVKNLSVLVFASNGKIVSRMIDVGSLEPSFRVALGEKVSIWAIANWKCSDLSRIEDEKSLRSLVYGIDDALYQDGDVWRVLMTAHAEKAFTSESQTCAMGLDRAVSEVRVESVSLDLDYLSAVLDVPADEVRVDGLYLINCVEAMTLGGTVLSYTNRSGNSSSGWYETSFSENDVGTPNGRFDSYRINSLAVWDLIPSADGRYTLGSHVFYCLPNPSTADAFDFDAPWSPRPTRVVLSLHTVTHGWLEYPVTIMSEVEGVRGLFANTRYAVRFNISEWTGYRYMDRDPEYSFWEQYFDGWTVVDLSEKL